MFEKFFSKYYPQKLVFCYHRVISHDIAQRDLTHPSLYVTPHSFERQIRWMKKMGNIVTLDRMLEKDKAVQFMVTFDDGWKDNFQYAYPIMKKYNAPWTIFISTQNIDNRLIFWTEEIGVKVGRCLKKKSSKYLVAVLQKKCNLNDKSCQDILCLLHLFIEVLKKEKESSRKRMLQEFYAEIEEDAPVCGDNYLLDWNEILDMKNNGVQIGSHTHSHALLDRIDNSVIDQELKKSKLLLDAKLEQDTDVIAYPNGYFQNNYLLDSLKKNGYRYGFTLINHALKINSNPLLLPRLLLCEASSDKMTKRYFLNGIKYRIKSFFL